MIHDFSRGRCQCGQANGERGATANCPRRVETVDAAIALPVADAAATLLRAAERGEPMERLAFWYRWARATGVAHPASLPTASKP